MSVGGDLRKDPDPRVVVRGSSLTVSVASEARARGWPCSSKTRPVTAAQGRILTVYGALLSPRASRKPISLRSSFTKVIRRARSG